MSRPLCLGTPARRPELPGARLQFTAIGESAPGPGLASQAGFTYAIQVVDTADVTGDRRPDTVVRLVAA